MRKEKREKEKKSKKEGIKKGKENVERKKGKGDAEGLFSHF